MFKRLFRNRKSQKGAVLLEYGLLIAGVSLIGAAAVSTFGHKTTDLMATVAAVIPGAHTDDNNPIVSGHLIETTGGSTGIVVDGQGILTNNGTQRLNTNTGIDTTDLVIESQ